MELREATILFADLRGFSSIAATYPPEVVFHVLNTSFIRLSEVVSAHGGTIDRFMGDSIMVVFSGEPPATGEDATRAVHCAVDMQIAMDESNRELRNTIRPELYMGIGINTGAVIAGVLGSEIYSTRTVIGEEVNVAARIEAFCLRGQILISDNTFAHVRDFAETTPPVEVFVKGRDAGLILREVHSIPSAGKIVPRRERRSSPRVPVRLPFKYQVVANDVVSPVRAQGVVHDIGYRGLLVELERPMGLFEELKLDLELPIIGHRARELYGRVVNTKDKGERTLFGLEFTSISDETSRYIRRLVQLLLQGAGGAAYD